MKKFISTLDKIEDALVAALLAAQLIIVMSFTIARYTQLWKMPWGEEFSRYCMIWMIFVGVIIGAKTGAHFAVTAFDGFMPKPVLKIFICIRIALVAAFNFFCTYYAFIVIQKQMSTGQLSPALQIPMWTMYCAVPFGLFFMTFRYAAHNINVMRGIGKDEEVQL